EAPASGAERAVGAGATTGGTAGTVTVLELATGGGAACATRTYAKTAPTPAESSRIPEMSAMAGASVPGDRRSADFWGAPETNGGATSSGSEASAGADDAGDAGAGAEGAAAAGAGSAIGRPGSTSWDV